MILCGFLPEMRIGSARLYLLFPIQNGSDLDRQIAHGKRFLNKLHALIQHSPMSDYISRIAGHEQGIYVRIERLQFIRQIPTVHFGHNHINNKQFNFPLEIFGQTQSFAGYPGDNNLITQSFQASNDPSYESPFHPQPTISFPPVPGGFQ